MEDWIGRFEGLKSLEQDARHRLLARSKITSIPKDRILFGPGKPPENMLLLLDGTIRVHQVAENGREIVLYRVHAGESCVLTTACLLAYQDYNAEGVAETAVRAVAIPRREFDALIAESASFRRFVFTAYSRRITDLLIIIEEVVFGRIDLRLAQKLLELGRAGKTIKMTHQQLATELGTAREVVSRQLHEFQRRNWVLAMRGEIRIEDLAALKKFSGAAA